MIVGKVIAIPAEGRGEYLNFWRFIPDKGQTLADLSPHAIRFTWCRSRADQIKRMLITAKRAYYADLEQIRKDKLRPAYKVFRSVIETQRAIRETLDEAEADIKRTIL